METPEIKACFKYNPTPNKGLSLRIYGKHITNATTNYNKHVQEIHLEAQVCKFPFLLFNSN